MKPSLELWKIIYKWLNYTDNNISQNYIKEELTSHPDYPALVSVADFLDQGKFSYNVVQADTSYIKEFNYPLLAHYKQPGQEYLKIIHELKEWNEENFKFWSGIVIFPKIGSKWVNEKNTDFIRNEKKSKIKLFFISLFALIITLQILSKVRNYYEIAFGLFSLIGILICILLIYLELGYQSEILKQVCNSVSHNGCEKVLKSKYSRGIFGISISSISISYFIFQFISILFSLYIHQLFNILFLLSLFGSVFIIWSIYIQVFRLKKYCTLCISMVLVLIFQLIIGVQKINFNVISADIIFLLKNFEFYSLILFLTLAIVIVMKIKKILITNSELKTKNNDLIKLKYDITIFIHQLKNERKVDTSIIENDLILGDLNSPLLLTVACNPYCSPCARTHNIINNILKSHIGIIKVQIRFLFDINNDNDFKKNAAKEIIYRHIKYGNNSMLEIMLNDWFNLLDLDKWKEKWDDVNSDDLDVSEIMKYHFQWINDSKIKYTPTLFINGYKLPSRYEIDDLDKLIPLILETDF